MSVCTLQGQGCNWKENTTFAIALFIQSKSHDDLLLETWRLCLESVFIYSSCSYTAPLESIRSRTLGPLLCPGTTIHVFWTISANSQCLLRNSLIQHFGSYLSVTHNWAKAARKMFLTFSGQVNILILKHLYRFSHKEDFLSNAHRNVWRQHFYSQRKLF